MKFFSGFHTEQGDYEMRKLMLFAGLAITVLISGLFMTNLVFAEQSTESGTVSSDKKEAGPSSVAPASEETDSDAESKRGQIGGGLGGTSYIEPTYVETETEYVETGPTYVRPARTRPQPGIWSEETEEVEEEPEEEER